jgi:anthranilate phosphoribosyltransferase
MANPAGVRHLLLGVSDPVLHDEVAVVVAQRGARHALVVRGEDGLDEVSISGRTRVLHVTTSAAGDLDLREGWIDPTTHGVPVVPLSAIQGGDAARNAALGRAVLAGEPGPVRDVVVLNAAAALVAADLCDDLDLALGLAAESVDSGAAAGVLDRVVALSASR